MDKELRFSYRLATAHTSPTIACSFLLVFGAFFREGVGGWGWGRVVGVVSVGVTQEGSLCAAMVVGV